MTKLNNAEISKLISINTFNDTSLFAVSVIDLAKYEMIYANQAMKNIMSDMTATNCWEAIYGQEAPCMWCKAPTLLVNLKKSHKHASQSKVNNGYVVYEHFNEVANKWYQVQEKAEILEDGREVLISFALDISLQKEAQSKLIDTHVKLTNQTQALELAQKKLKEQAHRDPLTNMYNRRYFADVSEKMVSVSKRAEEPLCAMIMDIDNFKKINDAYGHEVGDEVIKHIADKISSSIRASDLSARWGGEEFVVLLCNTTVDDAVTFANALRKDIENITYKANHTTITSTVSIGLEAFNHAVDKNINETLNRADKALYKAKESGKNRVCTES